MLGKVCGHLTVIGESPQRTKGATGLMWVCQCRCGRRTIVGGYRLRSRKTRSCGCLIRESAGKRKGKASPSWRGDSVSYGGIHVWVRKHFTKSGVCVHCKNKNNLSGKTEWANVKDYNRLDRKDWLELCRSCHKIFDFNKTGRKRKRGPFVNGVNTGCARRVFRRSPT